MTVADGHVQVRRGTGRGGGCTPHTSPVPGQQQLYLEGPQLLTSFWSQQLNLVVVVLLLVCDLLPPVVGVLGESVVTAIMKPHNLAYLPSVSARLVFRWIDN